MSSFPNRMIRAAKLDVNLYEEVEADKQAMGVVVLASLAAGYWKCRYDRYQRAIAGNHHLCCMWNLDAGCHDHRSQTST